MSERKMTKLIIKSKATGPKRQLELPSFYKTLTQCSTGLIFISADIISIEERKRDEICNLIKFFKCFHIFITLFFLGALVVRPQSVQLWAASWSVGIFSTLGDTAGCSTLTASGYKPAGHLPARKKG